MTDDGLRTLRTNLCEQRILLYLDAPSLVVSKVPVEAVDVMQRKHIDELTNGVDTDEVARYVEVSATVCKAWCVSDVNGWNAYLRCLAVDERQRLAQGLDAVEHACCRCSCDAYLLCVSVQLVALSVVDGLVNGEDDVSTALDLADGRANTCSLLDV